MCVELTSATRKLCVIGDPVAHSKSPLLHNAMLSTLGLDYAYLRQQVPKGFTAEWLHTARAEGYAGFNATMPHKEALLPLMDVLEPYAADVGAVNTVCIRDGKYYGFNTDGPGFLAALADEGVVTTGKTVVLLGAGGAARAVALALLRMGGAKTVYILNRTPERAAAICALDGAGRLIPAGLDGDTLHSLCAVCEVLVNCTSLGMEGTVGQFEDLSFLDVLPPAAAVCDLIYAPPETALLRAARQRGLRTINGLGMLLHQAILALEHFTQTKIDAHSMADMLRQII